MEPRTRLEDRSCCRPWSASRARDGLAENAVCLRFAAFHQWRLSRFAGQATTCPPLVSRAGITGCLLANGNGEKLASLDIRRKKQGGGEGLSGMIRTGKDVTAGHAEDLAGPPFSQMLTTGPNVPTA